VLKRVALMVCKIMGKDLDGTSEHEEWFEGGRQIVHKESMLGVGGFPFLLSLLIFLYSTATDDFEITSHLPSLDSSWQTLSSFVLITISHYCYQCHLPSTPSITGDSDLSSSEIDLVAITGRVLICTWRPWSCNLGCHNRVNLDILMEARMLRTWRP